MHKSCWSFSDQLAEC